MRTGLLAGSAFHPAAPGIHISNANVTYQGKILFSTLNFHLSAGQWTCLLGPSGVGKTSLLRLIAGLPVGAQASAEIQLSDKRPIKNTIAYMAQTDLLLPWLNSLDNVLLNTRLQSKKVTPAEQERAIELLHAVGLTAAIDKKPCELSGGMRQRVALARTLFVDKPIVLMDEPFAALDAITKWRLQNLAAEMFKHKTVLLITHDPLEALRLGHRLHVLAGSPAKLDMPLLLTGEPPREIDNPGLLQLHQELLARLQQAQQCEP